MVALCITRCRIAPHVFTGVHVGCYDCSRHGSIRTISDLKGKAHRHPDDGLKRPPLHGDLLSHVGLDPRMTSRVDDVKAIELFAEEKVDAFLAFPPEPQEPARAERRPRHSQDHHGSAVGRSNFCCMAYTQPGLRGESTRWPPSARFAPCSRRPPSAHPIRPPRRGGSSWGFAANYDHAVEALGDIPYLAWRDYDPADSLRFYALQLREAGMISPTGRADRSGTNWQYFEELKQERSLMKLRKGDRR